MPRSPSVMTSYTIPGYKSRQVAGCTHVTRSRCATRSCNRRASASLTVQCSCLHCPEHLRHHCFSSSWISSRAEFGGHSWSSAQGCGKVSVPLQSLLGPAMAQISRAGTAAFNSGPSNAQHQSCSSSLIWPLRNRGQVSCLLQLAA